MAISHLKVICRNVKAIHLFMYYVHLLKAIHSPQSGQPSYKYFNMHKCVLPFLTLSLQLTLECLIGFLLLIHFQKVFHPGHSYSNLPRLLVFGSKILPMQFLEKLLWRASRNYWKKSTLIACVVLLSVISFCGLGYISFM